MILIEQMNSHVRNVVRYLRSYEWLSLLLDGAPLSLLLEHPLLALPRSSLLLLRVLVLALRERRLYSLGPLRDLEDQERVRLDAVLVLLAILLDTHFDPRWIVTEAYTVAGAIDLLSSMSAPARYVLFHVLWMDEVLLGLREDLRWEFDGEVHGRILPATLHLRSPDKSTS